MNKLDALIIEDDPKLGVIFQAALQHFGFETQLDDTGGSLPAKFAEPAPALIVLDIHLPHALGTEILEQIRADERWASAVVIVTTADIFLAKSLEGRADHVLIKPVSVESIKRIVGRHWPDLIPVDSQFP